MSILADQNVVLVELRNMADLNNRNVSSFAPPDASGYNGETRNAAAL
jgi:hypothetical protein